MIKDKLGNNIEVGSIIAYGHNVGRCGGIRIGKVLGLKISQEPWGYGVDKFRTVYSITVRGIDDDWSSNKPRLNTKNGTLSYPERIVVIGYDALPDQYQELLSQI